MDDYDDPSFGKRLTNAVLRLPGLVFLECIISNKISAELLLGNEEGVVEWMKHHFVNFILYSVGCSLSFMPVKSLKLLYAFFLSMFCVVYGHVLTTAYAIQWNGLAMEYDGIKEIVLLASPYMNLFTTNHWEQCITIILTQVTLGLLVIYIMKWKNCFIVCFASLIPWPHALLSGTNLMPSANSILLSQTVFLAGCVLSFVLNCDKILSTAKEHIANFHGEIGGWPGLITVIWTKYQFGLMFTMYWTLKFLIHFSNNIANDDLKLLLTESLMPANITIGVNTKLCLISIGQCTSTIFSLIGLSCIVTRFISLQFHLLRSWLNWSLHNHPPDSIHVGIANLSDGMTILAMSLYTDLASVDIESRIIVLGYIILTVSSSQFPVYHTIIDETMMATLASPAATKWKHLRVTVAILLLFGTCSLVTFMMYYLLAIKKYQSLWLMVNSHNYFITFWLSLGSVCIYLLTVADLKSNFQIYNVEDITFYIRGGCRAIEYLENLGLCLYLMYVFYSEISSIPVVILLGLYVYYSIAWKGKKAWNLLKMRRHAAAKVSSLNNPTMEKLQKLDDVCPICYQELKEVQFCKEMHCKHIFHGNCLKKWFYVRDQCPVCHTDFNKTPTSDKETSMETNELPASTPSTETSSYSDTSTTEDEV